MPIVFLLLLVFLGGCATTAEHKPGQFQAPVHRGLAEDPDVLDPTLARTYVGRIVFASICDKLFDIDEKLAVSRPYDIQSIPAHVIIDKQGIVRHVFSAQLAADRHVAEALVVVRQLAKG